MRTDHRSDHVMILNLKWGEFLDDKTLFSFGKTQLRHNKNMNKSKRKQPLASILETTTPSCRNDSNCFSSASTMDANHECLILQYECYMFQTSHTTCHTPFMSIYILSFSKNKFLSILFTHKFPFISKKTLTVQNRTGTKKFREKKTCSPRDRLLGCSLQRRHLYKADTGGKQPPRMWLQERGWVRDVELHDVPL